MDMNQSDKKVAPRDLMDILLDVDNRDPIVLADEEGKQFTFEQIALIPFRNNGVRRLYIILKPMDKLIGVEPDEAVVFLVDDTIKGDTVLKYETDEEVAIGVFDKYYRLLDSITNARYTHDYEETHYLKLLNKKRKGGTT